RTPPSGDCDGPVKKSSRNGRFRAGFTVTSCIPPPRYLDWGAGKQNNMRIVTLCGNPFDGQFSMRLKSSARALDLPCDVYSQTDPRLDRPLALLRNFAENRGEDVLLANPETQILRRPAILLDEKDFDVAIYFDADSLALRGPMFMRSN